MIILHREYRYRNVVVRGKIPISSVQKNPSKHEKTVQKNPSKNKKISNSGNNYEQLNSVWMQLLKDEK